MPIKCEQYNHACVMTVSGDLAGENAAQARKLTDEYIEKRQIVDVVVDLEAASFIDSEGLETLLWIKRRCEDLFGQVKLVNPDENCRKILQITRLEHRFETHGDLAAAMKTMR